MGSNEDLSKTEPLEKKLKPENSNTFGGKNNTYKLISSKLLWWSNILKSKIYLLSAAFSNIKNSEFFKEEIQKTGESSKQKNPSKLNSLLINPKQVKARIYWNNLKLIFCNIKLM